MQKINQDKQLQKFDQIQNQTKVIIETLNYLVKILKKEATRTYSFINKYTSIKQDNKYLFKLSNYNKLQEYKLYQQLITKKFIKSLENLSQEYLQFKMELQKASRLKLQDIKSKIKDLQTNSQKLLIKFGIVWKKQYYFLLNYRIDIACKELERWSNILEQEKPDENKIKQEIAKLFT